MPWYRCTVPASNVITSLRADELKQFIRDHTTTTTEIERAVRDPLHVTKIAGETSFELYYTEEQNTKIQHVRECLGAMYISVRGY